MMTDMASFPDFYRKGFGSDGKKKALNHLLLLQRSSDKCEAEWMDYRNPHSSLNAIETLVLSSTPEERETLMSIIENVLAYRLQGEEELRAENHRLRFLISEICDYAGIPISFDLPIAEQRRILLEGICRHTQRVSSYLTKDRKLAKALKELSSNGSRLIDEQVNGKSWAGGG